MAVVVSKRGVKVKANGKYHSLGETISGLTETEEERLVEGGTCKYVPSSIVSPDTSLDDPPNDDNLPKESNQPANKVNKSSASKKSKQVAEPPEDNNEVGPDTSHPLE